jgi:galactokinase
VLLMDFQSEAATLSMMPAHARVLVLDSGAHHALEDGGYARVFQECRDAALALGAPSLRAAEAAELSRLPQNLRDRAFYVWEENIRVRTMAAALEQGDLIAAGAIMNEGHAGIRDLFKITVPETDALQALAAATPGVFGARQMGGGFGGSVVALVDAEKAETAVAAITSATAQSGFIAAFVDGAAEIIP